MKHISTHDFNRNPCYSEDQICSSARVGVRPLRAIIVSKTRIHSSPLPTGRPINQTSHNNDAGRGHEDWTSAFDYKSMSKVKSQGTIPNNRWKPRTRRYLKRKLRVKNISNQNAKTLQQRGRQSTPITDPLSPPNLCQRKSTRFSTTMAPLQVRPRRALPGNIPQLIQLPNTQKVMMTIPRTIVLESFLIKQRRGGRRGGTPR